MKHDIHNILIAEKEKRKRRKKHILSVENNLTKLVDAKEEDTQTGVRIGEEKGI